MTKFRASFICSILLLLVGCDSSTQPSTLRTTTMQIGSKSFTLEVADSDPVREYGLMKRDSMPADHGMIFVFGSDAPRSFWMKNTRFPLDIMYVRSDGTVVSIRQMRAYDLTAVPSAAPAKYAIELNNGVASTTGIREGDKVQIPPDASNPAE